MNILIAAGYLGGNAETRYAESGLPITNFSLPLEAGWGDNKQMSWLKCTLFGRKDKQGVYHPHGLADYLKKGRFVTVNGELTLQEWTSKEGKQMANLAMNVKDVSLGPDRGAASQSQSPASSAPERMSRSEIPNGGIDEDIPF